MLALSFNYNPFDVVASVKFITECDKLSLITENPTLDERSTVLTQISFEIQIRITSQQLLKFRNLNTIN